MIESFTVGELLETTLATAVVATIAMTVTAVISRRIGKVGIVDITWGIGLNAIAVVCAVLGGDRRGWLLVGPVAVWGLRLSWYIFQRSRGQGEDPRYLKLLDGGGFRVAVRKVFVIQGLALWFVALPVQTAAVWDVAWWWPVWVGLALWLVGVVFETVGDTQLAAYKRDPDRGPVMDRGLWAWSRHPNYFGDACVWWGIWLAGGLASGWLPALLSVPAPIAMTYFLVYATGARPLEQTMRQRPGYPEYAARTSMIFPLPPKRP